MVNESNIAESVILTLKKGSFNEIYETLSSKYKVIEKKIPFVGNKFAMFEEDKCYIYLASPHLSFKMYAEYTTKNLASKILKKKREKEEEKN